MDCHVIKPLHNILHEFEVEEDLLFNENFKIGMYENYYENEIGK